MKAIVAIGLVLLLSACNTAVGPLSVEGACAAFKDPKRVVYGKTRLDQRWISGTQETGIRVCKWQRPKGLPRGALTS